LADFNAPSHDGRLGKYVIIIITTSLLQIIWEQGRVASRLQYVAYVF